MDKPNKDGATMQIVKTAKEVSRKANAKNDYWYALSKGLSATEEPTVVENNAPQR